MEPRKRIKVRDTDRLIIEGWMLDLPLPRDEMMIYALIYSWTHYAGACFYRRQFFAEWADTDCATIDEIIKNLEELGLIEQKFITVNGVAKIFLIAIEENEVRDEN